MASEKNNTKIEDVRILNKISKRLDTIEKYNDKLKENEIKQKEELNRLKTTQRTEIGEFKDKCEEINKSIKDIKKEIFQIGKQLKNKITKEDFKIMNDEVEKKEYEEFITKKELEKTYSYYTN